MANKDHTLDPLIVDAARAEFLEYGYQKASLHRIAERAGTTTGALYTRYKGKDDLFCSLVQPLLEEIGTQVAPMEAVYRKAYQTHQAEDILSAIRLEEKIYLDLLFQHYDECVLLYCKSAGSSLEEKMNEMMNAKAHQSAEFFRRAAKREIDFNGIEPVIIQQFYCYRMVLQRGYTREEAVSCMKTVALFQEAGWKAILSTIL